MDPAALAERGFEFGPLRKEISMQIIRIGLDLAKYVFQVHGVDAREKTVLRKTLRRDVVAQFFSKLPPCVVGMEASNGAHYWARVLTDLGHEVRLISPQFVTPYVKSNKNDRNDAEAICEAVGRPSMRFVPPKSPDQLTLQAVHRIRQRLVSDRTRLVNQIRGLLTEHGIVIARDINRLRHALGRIADGDEKSLDDMMRDLVRDIRGELAELDKRIAGYTRASGLSSRTTRPVSASERSKGSGRSRRRRWSRRSAIGAASRTGVSSPLGWGWFPGSDQAAARLGCLGSANAETVTSEH